MRQIPSLNEVTKAGITLGTFAFFGVVLLTSIQWLTKERIAHNIQQSHLQRLHDIITVDSYDNDLLGSMTEEAIAINGLAGVLKIYKAQLGEVAVANIFEVTSLEGYSGAINLLVGVNLEDGRLRGVRVTSHKETPGLGDKIETAKGDWILQFAGKSLDNPSLVRWKVKKDGGSFDQFTGATITPRAVVNAVREVLTHSAKGLTAHE